MIPELGQMALILALLLAAVQAVFPLLGAWRGSPALIRMARPAAAGQFVFVALAYAVLTHAFLVNDFPWPMSRRTLISPCPGTTACRRCGAHIRVRCCCG